MKPENPPPRGNADEEVSALIETLQQTGQRLEELTAGEVDTVTDRRGRTILLRRAQDHMRHNEAAKQAAILNALPAHIALLDAQGIIISMNEAWGQFKGAHVLQGPGYCVGLNYLEICDRAQGDDAALAQQAAAGIRSVLSGEAKSFSIEYPCDSPLAQRWFLMTVTPLADDPPHGVVVMHLNISERKRAADALGVSKTLLQLVVEHVPARIFWKDRDLRYLGCNTLFAKDAGHSRPDELTGKTDFEMGWKEQAELYRGDDKTVLESGAPKLDIEEPQTTPDGNTIWLRTSKVPLRDRDNQIIGILGLYQDITERKRAEQALAQESHRNQVFLRNASDGVHILDADGNVLEVSDSFCQMLGYSREELIGANVSLWDVQWSPQDLKQLIAQQIAKEGRSVLQTRHRRRDGSFLDVEISGQGLELDGKPVLFNSARDVTARNQVEQSLQESERKYRRLIENSPDIVYTFSVKRGGIYFSSKVISILGYSVEHLYANPFLWNESIHPEDRAVVAKAIEELKTGSAFKVEYRIKNADGDWRWLHDRSISSREENGDFIIEGLAMDITERKAAEEQLQHRKEEIQRYIEQLKTAFMSTVEVATTLSEMRDPYTAGHERRVAKIAVAIGAELRFDAHRQEGLRVAGHLHDVGKMIIPAEILSKPGKLSAIEFQLIQGHAQAGYDVLKAVEFPWPVAEIALQHHERIDGSGYPQGLKGEAILLEARIIAVADVVEAMSSHRPYRPGFGVEAALAEIERGSGTIYDAQVAAACLKLFREQAYVIPG